MEEKNNKIVEEFGNAAKEFSKDKNVAKENQNIDKIVDTQSKSKQENSKTDVESEKE